MKLLIKETIKERGFTLQQVAERIGTSKQSLHNIINKGNPVVSTLDAIARAIDVPITALIAEEDEGEYLNAMVTHRGKFYHAHTLDELENIVTTIKAISQEPPIEEAEEKE